MKSFKTCLKEWIAPTAYNSNSEMMEGPYLPITREVRKILNQTTQRKTLFHVTDPKHLDFINFKLRSTQAISASNKPTYSLFRGGIGTGGGVLAVIDANVLLGANLDISTQVDTFGNRYFNLARFAYADPTLLKQHKQEVVDQLVDLPIQEKKDLYMTLSLLFWKKYQKRIVAALYEAIAPYDKNTSYAEIIVDDVKLVMVYVDSSKLEMIDYDYLNKVGVNVRHGDTSSQFSSFVNEVLKWGNQLSYQWRLGQRGKSTTKEWDK